MEGLATIQNRGSLVNLADYAMSKQAMLEQVKIIQDTLQTVMKDGEHYGKIPGCGNKPTLLKPGAEKISTTFHLAPAYEIITTSLPNGHREYQVICTLKHIMTDTIVGQGVGSCSTMEGKFRYRTGEVVFTGKPVPHEYWNDRKPELIGGKGFGVKKNDAGKWEIVRAGEKVEHDNPADYYNTCLKMAKKRAHVDAVLTATAASDIFTQDIEDMPEVINAEYSDVPPEQQTGSESKENKPQDKRVELMNWLVEMKGDLKSAEDYLEKMTSGEGKDGRKFTGKRDVSALTEKQLTFIYNSVQKKYEDWKEKQEATDADNE